MFDEILLLSSLIYWLRNHW